MSGEDDDRAIERLERRLLSGGKRTVAQNRILAMMGDYRREIIAEKAEADRARRSAEAKRRQEVLAQQATDQQDEADDGSGEDASTGDLRDTDGGVGDPA